VPQQPPTPTPESAVSKTTASTAPRSPRDLPQPRTDALESAVDHQVMAARVVLVLLGRRVW
jgi:hypothetical protein